MGFQNLTAICATYGWIEKSFSQQERSNICLRRQQTQTSFPLRPSCHCDSWRASSPKKPRTADQRHPTRVETRKGRGFDTPEQIGSHELILSRDSGWQVGREGGETEGMSDRNTLLSWVYSRNARLVQQLEILSVWQIWSKKAISSVETKQRRYF